MRRKSVATIECNNATAKRKNAMSQQMSEKQTEKTPEESKVMYYTLFENTGTGMLVIDEDTTILTVNREFERISSYSKMELEGKRSWTEFVAKGYLEKMKEYHHLRRIDPNAAPRTYETKLIDKQGKVLDALLTVALIPGTKRSIVSLIDITEHKETENELEKLARYPAENPSPILRLDKKGVILHANEASDPLLKEWGKKVGDYAPKYWMDLVNEACSCQSSKNADVQLGNKTFLFTLVPTKNADYANLYGRDITDRVMAEQALRKSEERFAQVAENAGEWIWEVDTKGLYTYSSPAVEKILGYKPEEVVGKKHFYDFFAPEVKQDLTKAAFYSFAKRQMFRAFVNPNLHKNGNVVILETSGTPIVNERGELLGYRGADTDITERRRVEEALRESEKKYRSIAENNFDVIFTLDREGRFDYVTPSVRLFGYDPKELVGRPVRNYVVQSEASNVVRALGRLMKGEVVQGLEVEILNRDGSRSLVEANASPLFRDADVIGAQAILRDITERKRIEELTSRLAAIVESSGDAIISKTLEGIINTWNEGAETIYGYSSKEAVGKSISILVPQDRSNEMPHILQRIGKGESIERYETERVRKDGKRIFVSLTISPIRDSSGRIVGASTTARDVTERKQMEDDLRESEKRFRLLTENLPIGVYSAQPDAVSSTTFISGRIFEQTGYSANEYKNDPAIWNRIIHPEDREVVWKNVEDHRKNRTLLDIEYRVIARDGTVKWLRDKASPVVDKNGTIVSIDGFTEDITEQKRLEEELKKRTEHLEELVEERTKEIQMLNTSIMRRLVQKTNQIDTISKLRDRIRTVPDISTGMDLILGTALKDLEMDAGAVLVFNRKEYVADVRAFKSTTEKITLKPSYPGCRLSECEVFRLDQAVSKTEGISCILGTTSVHCAPIHLGRELEGALMLGSQEALTLDESDRTILRMYADLASTLFETQNLVVTPAREATRPYRHYELEFGRAYLTKNVEFAFEIFRDNVLGGLEGLCITREYPLKVREKQGLIKTPIIWLSGESAEDEATVNSLQDLSVIINDFLSKAAHGIILLDGFEYLITNHGFDSFIRFLQLSRSRVEEKDAILIAPMLEETLELRHARLIAREMSTIESKEKQ